jgi:hypothetical protein
MKAFVAAVIVAIAVAVASWFGLATQQQPASEAFAIDATTRVGNPGHNLIVPD